LDDSESYTVEQNGKASGETKLIAETVRQYISGSSQEGPTNTD